MDLTIKNTTECLRTLMDCKAYETITGIDFDVHAYRWLLMKLTHYIEENLKLPSTKDIHRWQKQAVKKFSNT